MPCLLHLPILGFLLNHGPLTKPNAVDLIVELTIVDLDGDDHEVEKTNGTVEWFSFLKWEFHIHLEATEDGDVNDDKVSIWLH
jgi:hypothetical protein